MNNTHAKRLKLLKDDAEGEDMMSKVNAIFARAGEEYLELIKDTPNDPGRATAVLDGLHATAAVARASLQLGK